MSQLYSLIVRLPIAHVVRRHATDLELIGLTVLLSLILIGHGLQ